jgi:hypothetical protein
MSSPRYVFLRRKVNLPDIALNKTPIVKKFHSGKLHLGPVSAYATSAHYTL